MPLCFLADLNVSPDTVQRLRTEGWQALRVNEVLPANASDVVILELAQREGYVVVTQDLDFSALVAIRGWTQPSLITLRLSDSSPGVVTQRLLEVLPILEEELGRGLAATVADDSVRVRRLPIQ